MSAAMSSVAGCSTSYGMLSSPSALLWVAAMILCVAPQPNGCNVDSLGRFRKYNWAMLCASC
eukprot:11624306-Prorocentrum_lima.AAC.1